MQNTYSAYFLAKQEAQQKIDKLIKKHAVKWRHGSIIDNGKSLLIPKEIKQQIDEIRAEAEKLKPIIKGAGAK